MSTATTQSLPKATPPTIRIVMRYFYWLAEFREKRAFLLVANFLRLPENQLDYLFNDLLHEDVPKVLVFETKIQSLTDIIENTNAYKFARAAAMETYKLLYKENFIDKTKVVAYFRSLIYEKLSADNNPFLLSCIANVKRILVTYARHRNWQVKYLKNFRQRQIDQKLKKRGFPKPLFLLQKIQ